MTALPRQDLDHVLKHTAELWSELRGQQILITGGTGFFGKWLIETYLWAEQQLGLGGRISVLTRNPEAFQSAAPHLAQSPALRLLRGDIRQRFDLAGDFSHVIHGAASVRVDSTPAEKLETWHTIVQGTQNILEFSASAQVRKLLFISSGAVYGPQPATITRMSEEYLGGPDPSLAASAYGEGKRAAEILCALHAGAGKLEAKIARCFAFVGPHLPLDSHFAIGSFIRDAMARSPIRIAGDGTPLRSYLYAADLCVWLWHILVRGQSLRPYNVGSADALSIREVADEVADLFSPRPEILVAQSPKHGRAPSAYIPNVDRVQAELGLRQEISVREAIRRTIQWYTSNY